MRVTTAAAVAALTSQATATLGFWNLDAPKYSSPSNRDNKCDAKQQSGYDFADLGVGAGVGAYGGFDFSGFTAGRYGLRKRTFLLGGLLGGLGGGASIGAGAELSAGFYISGEIDAETGPSIVASADLDFSIDFLTISADFDVDVEAVFEMPTGKLCKQKFKCGKGGAQFRNKQCGGAKKVKFQQPRGWGRRKCGLRIHKIKFDCDKPQPPVKIPNEPSASTAFPTTSSASIVVPPSSSATVPVVDTTTVATAPSVPVPSSPTGTSVVSVPSGSATIPATTGRITSTTADSPSSSTATVPATTSSVTADVPYLPPSNSTTQVPETSTSPPIGYAPPPYDTTTSTTALPEMPTTGVPAGYPLPSTTTANAPTTSSVVPSSSSIAYSPSAPVPSGPASYPVPSNPTTADAPTTTKPGASYAPTTLTSVPVPSNPPRAECPSIVPSCLNTWMWESGCENNADANCYCKSKDFIEDVMECIGSWGDDCNEQNKASQYLIGICADHVKENPALVAAVPKCDAPAPAPIPTPSTGGSTAVAVPTTTDAPAVPTGPVTTVICSTVVTYPQTDAPDATTSATPIVSTIDTTMTVPYVSFSTAPVVPGETQTSVGLYQPVPKTTASTTALPVPSSGVPSVSRYAPTTTGVTRFTGAADKNAVGYVAAAVAMGAWFF